MKLHERVLIGPAKHGQGVFAKRPFARHEIISDVDGEILSDPNHESDYCIDLGDGLTLEPSTPFRYLNHSCQPNCEIILLLDEGNLSDVPRVCLQALLNSIDGGDELTIDYGWPAVVSIPCRCGSSQCRGWIVHSQELSNLL